MRRWRRGWFRVQVAVTAAVCAAALLFAAPNLVSRAAVSNFPSWLPSKQVQLGLEFTGGQSLLLDPDWKSVFDEVLRELRNAVRATLREHKIRYEDLRIARDAVELRVFDPAAVSFTQEALVRALHSSDIRAFRAIRRLPSISVQSMADGKITVALNELGRVVLHARSMVATIDRLDRQLRCYEVADYRIEREGERIRLTMRNPFVASGSTRCMHI